tara:strand:+ start:7142 stop:7417 length:276 start_codon:yes stop_codon:yes gene_type:complete
MKDDFNNLLDLIEKSINIEDQDMLQNFESKILTLSTSLNDQIKNKVGVDTDLKASDMDKLNELIQKLSDKHENQKKFLTDFQNFLKSRKIN